MSDLFSDQSYWHRTSAPPQSPRDAMPDGADVVVVGGGLLGVSTSYWLARGGASVVLLERAGLATGATGRNGGFMVAGTAESYPAAIARIGHADARAVLQLTLDNRVLLRGVLADEQIDCDYREVGNMHLALSEQQLAAMAYAVEVGRADGFMADVIDRAAVQKLVDTPLGEEIVGGAFAEGNGTLHSARLVYGLAQATERHGARVYTNTEVTNISSDGAGVHVETSRGALRASAAVVAVNAWTGQLVPQLHGVVTPVRGQILAYEPCAPVFSTSMGAELTPTGEYWQQTPDGTIVLGGCRAIAPDGEVGVRELAAHDAVQAALDGVLPRLFPELAGLRVAQRWAGPMAFTPDHMPIADAAPGMPGVWVVGGFSGHGMPFGLMLGRLLAAAARGERPAELAPFRLDRPSLVSTH
jgi:glycine/D-amino acid oxidase-like deaminating enzyme